jgi:hypothetical protein
MTISCHNCKPKPAVVCAAAGDNLRIEVKRMDQTVYSQVLITCTTINVVIIISTLTMWIGTKIHDHREKKKQEREEQAKKEEAAQ